METDGLSLEQAIVAQACDDYRQAIRGKCRNPELMLADVMQFFQSNWYKWLTKIDHKVLIKKLDEEWENGKRLIEAGNKVECIELEKEYSFVCPICGGKAETREMERETLNGATRYRNYACTKCKASETFMPCPRAVQSDE